MNGYTQTNKWMVALTVITGTIMSALDTSIVNVALPYMRGNLGVSVEEITWVATGYMLSSVIIMPITGMLSARFGRRNLYLINVFLFTASSFMCGVSWDLASLVFFRILQGIGGGAIIPVSQAILRESFPPEEQGMAMGIYGFGVVLGPAFGPTIGGWLTDNYSWPWIFYINIPIGIINMLLVARFLHDPPYLKREKGKLDLPGLFFLVFGLGALQLMLEKGEQKDWFQSGFIVWLAVSSCLCLLLFIWRELVTDRPAVDLRVLKNLPFASGTMLGGVLGMGLYGSLFLLPLFLQQLLGYPAFDSGLVLMPRSLAMAIMMPIAGRFYNRLGPRALIGMGLVITAFSFMQLSAMSLDVGFWDLFIPQSLQGAGFGMIFVALSTAALASIKKSEMTAASGLYNVVRQVFGSVGIAIAATELTRGEQIFRAGLVKDITPFTRNSSYFLRAMSGTMASQGGGPALARYRALGVLNGQLQRQASMLSYNHVFSLVTVLFAISVPLVFLLKDGHPPEEGEIIID
ncbi:MAG: DHA2 family efflux MFS transporter permease subunit [Nitrospiraceae bacterium]|nr:DHA2 family efflux MFS transporter permease subunit [Nitrospiraceae bacterium]